MCTHKISKELWPIFFNFYENCKFTDAGGSPSTKFERHKREKGEEKRRKMPESELLKISV